MLYMVVVGGGGGRGGGSDSWGTAIHEICRFLHKIYQIVIQKNVKQFYYKKVTYFRHKLLKNNYLSKVILFNMER